ncbi:MAG: hypothetical protein ACOCWO_04625 [Candidatus Muiribacteriaceae bacterium]
MKNKICIKIRNKIADGKRLDSKEATHIENCVQCLNDPEIKLEYDIYKAAQSIKENTEGKILSGDFTENIMNRIREDVARSIKLINPHLLLPVMLAGLIILVYFYFPFKDDESVRAGEYVSFLTAGNFVYNGNQTDDIEGEIRGRLEVLNGIIVISGPDYQRIGLYPGSIIELEDTIYIPTGIVDLFSEFSEISVVFSEYEVGIEFRGNVFVSDATDNIYISVKKGYAVIGGERLNPGEYIYHPEEGVSDYSHDSEKEDYFREHNIKVDQREMLDIDDYIRSIGEDSDEVE